MANSISFSDICLYVVELPASQHWRPEFKVAKRNEVKNLTHYETFGEFPDVGQA